MEKSILNISAYKFVNIDQPEILQAKFRARCHALGIKGTILIANEGVNVALAGSEPSVRQFMRQMQDDQRFSNIEFKQSWSEQIPFRKVRIRVKDEIIMMRVPSVDPLENTAKHLSPQELKTWLDEGRDIVMFDARNDYELKVGGFKNGYDLNINNFREFPERVKEVPDEIKQKPVVMFCTGGVRCEKATPLAMAAGFKEVYQIDGGILKYFAECGDAHWQGECFVFDDRVAVDTDLAPSKRHYCLNCLETLHEQDMMLPSFKYNHSCKHCQIG